MTDVSDVITGCVCDVLKVDRININQDSGIDITNGWDSMAHLNILMCLEKKFLCEFSEDDFIFLRTVLDLKQKLEELLSD